MLSFQQVVSIEQVFKKKDNVILRKIADEVLLVPIHGDIANMQKLFVLDSVGEHIWNHLDGQRTLGEICNLVVDRFDVDKPRAQMDLQEFVKELIDADLITGAQ